MRRVTPSLPLLLVALALAAPARAQLTGTPDSASAARFARARRLVSDGNGAQGRALVDTLLAAAPAGSAEHAEALYWRATLAERATDAERDYRQLAVDYPRSPRAVDALVRLAQLDLVRGQPAAAKAHLTRLLRDHDDAPTRARANYWLARAALDADDQRGACDALHDAEGAVEAASDVARQIVALRARVTRCPSAAVAASVVGARDSVVARASAPAPAPAPTHRASSPGSRQFSVQLAAYDSRPGAEALAARLTKRGIEAHVTAGGTAPGGGPFRVRVGRYATRAEAAAAQRELKAKGLGGFVAEETSAPD